MLPLLPMFPLLPLAIPPSTMPLVPLTPLAPPSAEVGSGALREGRPSVPRKALAELAFLPGEPTISASFISGEPRLPLASPRSAPVSLSGRGREDDVAAHRPPQESAVV